MEEIGFLYQTPGKDGPSQLTVLLWTQSSRPNNQEPINLPSFEVDYFTYFVTVMGGRLVYTEMSIYRNLLQLHKIGTCVCYGSVRAGGVSSSSRKPPGLEADWRVAVQFFLGSPVNTQTL